MIHSEWCRQVCFALKREKGGNPANRHTLSLFQVINPTFPYPFGWDSLLDSIALGHSRIFEWSDLKSQDRDRLAIFSFSVSWGIPLNASLKDTG
tara:strand:+ start:145 stop:426 length:282 start_codon:yes stop_codon:yes gene_type:complete